MPAKVLPRSNYQPAFVWLLRGNPRPPKQTTTTTIFGIFEVEKVRDSAGRSSLFGCIGILIMTHGESLNTALRCPQHPSGRFPCLGTRQHFTLVLHLRLHQIVDLICRRWTWTFKVSKGRAKKTKTSLVVFESSSSLSASLYIFIKCNRYVHLCDIISSYPYLLICFAHLCTIFITIHQSRKMIPRDRTSLKNHVILWLKSGPLESGSLAESVFDFTYFINPPIKFSYSKLRAWTWAIIFRCVD